MPAVISIIAVIRLVYCEKHIKHILTQVCNNRNKKGERQHIERMQQQKLDYKLDYLKIMKETLPKEPNQNLKEVLKFLNEDIVPLIGGGDMIDGMKEKSFGEASSLNGTVATVVLDAEIIELLDSFIRSAQVSLQQQHIGMPV